MSTKALKLTIVIPVHNEERYLQSCLEAIARQTVPPHEVIVVDNNSTDHTVAIAKSYSFVRLIHEPKKGIAHARNAGFNAAEGDIIGRIDADSRIADNWVEECLNFFANQPKADAVSGSFIFYDLPFRQLTQRSFSILYFDIQKAIAWTEVLWGANMAMRRSAWDKVKSYVHNDNYIYEDIDLALNLHRVGCQVAHSKTLYAELSFLRGIHAPLKTVNYISSWPKTYFRNGYYGRGMIIYLLKLLILLPTFIYYGLAYLVRPRLSTRKRHWEK